VEKVLEMRPKLDDSKKTDNAPPLRVFYEIAPHAFLSQKSSSDAGFLGEELLLFFV
jgi:hypothetical protein